MIRKLLGGLYLISMMSLCDQMTQPLNEITVEEPSVTVMLDDNIRSLCQDIVELWHQDGYVCADESIAMLLDPKSQDLAYETMLRALDHCAHSEWQPSSQEGEELVALIGKIHSELAEEYDQMVNQLATRRIKCKCFTKVSTRELVACNACFEQATVKSKLLVKDCLQVNGLNGFVQSTNGGCFFATVQLGSGAIEDGAITNSKLADNSVSSNKIVNGSLLPSHLLFNTVDTFSAEPDLLRVYRGSITGNTGITTSGVGFTSSRTGAGAYTITFTLPYASATSYQIFVQPTVEFNRNVNITSQSAGSFSITIVDNANTPTDQNFMFFTIGSM